MRVLYWGTYDAEYVRNRVIIEGLRQNGIRVDECHVRLWHGTTDKVQSARKSWFRPALILRLLWAYVRLLIRYIGAGKYDVLFVGYAGHLDVFPARMLSWLSRKPLVFDAYLSIHETVVEDRCLVKPGSLADRLLFRLEKTGCALADLVLLDTEANITYFSEKYDLPREHFVRVWVGADPVFQPMVCNREDGRFRALYFGKFIPLHGVEHIIRAAWLLRDRPEIEFKFIGDGQTYDEMRKLASDLQLTNIIWGPRWLPPEQLAQEVACADVCLGIFGTSPKAQRVIPTKVYVALAMGKPVITADTPAARELLTDGENALLSMIRSPEDLSVNLAHRCQSLSLAVALAAKSSIPPQERVACHDVTQELPTQLVRITSSAPRRSMLSSRDRIDM